MKDEVEAARTAAINKEIKRVLTDLLLKVCHCMARFSRTCTSVLNSARLPFLTFVLLSFQVTDDLFNEIATKVMNEDDSSAERE